MEMPHGFCTGKAGDAARRFHRGSASPRILAVLAAMAVVIAVPFALKPQGNLLADADDTLVIVSPHNEAIRYEFTVAFGDHYKKKTGRSVRLDWRLPGGTSEIARYLKGEYYAAFQREWTLAGKEWTPDVAGAFDNPKIKPAEAPSFDTPAQAARRAFLNSNRGIGIDLFFGGGAYDFEQQASAGRLVPSDVIRDHPDWFGENSIPETVSGEPFYDGQARWIGACLSSFGICYNSDSLRRLGVRELPASWSDLTGPQLFKQVALADPTKSGSAAKAYEMVIQQQMQELVREAASEDPAILAVGWKRGLGIIQAASANARYFTDAGSKVPVDVSLGDAAAGMCIDFFGRFQSESVKIDGSPSRLQYFTPAGGSSVGVDPIGLFRGAPNRAVAGEFIAFVLSIEGQKLWNFKVGTPGGPERYALRRLPVRKELYSQEFAALRSDPGVMPYQEAGLFTYHPAWTGSLFKTMSFIIRVMCMDSHDEQASAWQALIAARFPREALRKFTDLSAVDYEVARTSILPTLASQNRIDEVRLAKELGGKFREQYREAERLAKEGK
ncbi:MAG: extracellular solute-binding protein [Terrimicrobiaceae bacterium]|nr:extracellular solute-binding protein [Terrimicrobiaceae bacterium]